jgi:hypothetical protein
MSFDAGFLDTKGELNQHPYGFGSDFGPGAGLAGTTFALPRVRQRRRSCETRLRREVTAEGDMSTFIIRLFRGA